MHNIKRIQIGFALALVASTGWAEYDAEDSNYNVQALLGGVKYNDLVFNSSVGTNSATIDMSTIPQLGGAWATRPKGEKLQYGLETSFLLGFKFDEVNYAYAGGGGAYVNISTSMWMIDFAGGGYVNVPLGEKLRLYGGAGPLLLFASYDSKQEFTDNTPNTSASDTVFGFGAYVRTGIELRVQPHAWLGAGVRGSWSNADFGDVGGEQDLSGIAAFITYTAGL